MPLVLIAAVAIAAAAVASAATSPQAELAAMKTAVGSKHSLHYVSVSSSPRSKVRMVCDVARGRGIQRITVTGEGHTGLARVIVYRSIAFIKGDAFTMRFYFGFSPKQAITFAGQWIFIQHSSEAFAAMADGATFGSFVGHLFPPNHLSLVRSGTLIGVHGTANNRGVVVDETVFAPAHGTPLPVKETATYPGYSGRDRWTMSHWNEAVHVTVPENAVPIEIVSIS